MTAATAAAAAAAAEPTAVAARESEGTAPWTLKTVDGEDATSGEEELQAEAVEEEVGCAAAEDASWSNKRCMSRCACANAPTLEASADTIIEASLRTRDIVSYEIAQVNTSCRTAVLRFFTVHVKCTLGVGRSIIL